MFPEIAGRLLFSGNLPGIQECSLEQCEERLKMGKQLFIAEKPSVAAEFAKALKVNGARRDGYLESDAYVVTWCVGHLVTMSYPESYDIALKKWSMNTLPFLPQNWKYEVIDSVKKQFQIVSGLLNRSDVDTIYICTDSGREGEYIYRLVDQLAQVGNKTRKRVWIDSQTEEEILRGIREAKDWSFYDNLSASAYLRAKEDYLMGINFSRALTLKFGPSVASFMRTNHAVISVGRVMTCVLGMVVRREREIRDFVKNPFYRILMTLPIQHQGQDTGIEAEWKAVEGSRFFQSPRLYKENGFAKKEDALSLIAWLSEPENGETPKAVLVNLEKKKEMKNPPLLFNLAELQNTCSKRFKISPDETLRVVQELYEKKMVTYPRTDARVLSSAVAKEIDKNIRGLCQFPAMSAFAQEILSGDSWKKIGKSRYTNDSQITDHYAIIPTGQGINQFDRLSGVAKGVYETICRRFLSVFYGPAVYRKYTLEFQVKTEHFFSSYRMLMEEGYLKVTGYGQNEPQKEGEETHSVDAKSILNEYLSVLRKGTVYDSPSYQVKEGETSPPKRYNSGSLILAMENAGQLIEDDELRAQIKGSGIGTSATRAEILKKLVSIHYLALNAKTQIVTPQKLGEAVFEVVNVSMKQLLNPELTASWEKGLTYVSEGTITSEEYMDKLQGFVSRRTNAVKVVENPDAIRGCFRTFAEYYPEKTGKQSTGRKQAAAEKA